MIQRPQSIFITIIIIGMIALFFLPIWQKIDKNCNTYIIYLYNLQKINSSGEVLKIIFLPYYFIGCILSVLIILISIYQLLNYKKRLLQIKLSFVNTLTISSLLGFYIYLSIKNENLIISNIQGEYQIGFIIPIICMICNIIANRFIKRDEYIIQSSENIS